MAMIRNIRFYLLPALCMSIMACTGTLFKNYGRIDPGREATRAFEVRLWELSLARVNFSSSSKK